MGSHTPPKGLNLSNEDGRTQQEHSTPILLAALINGARTIRSGGRCDPDLYDALASIVAEGKRTVHAVRERGILSRNTEFYETQLTFDGMSASSPRAIATRLERRERWFEGALRSTRTCDLVFVDPDNGIECGRRRHEKLGPKHAYFDELAPYVRRGQSLVVYHHLDRSARADVQVARAIERLASGVENVVMPTALLYRRGKARAFFIIPAQSHEALLNERVQRFMITP